MYSIETGAAVMDFAQDGEETIVIERRLAEVVRHVPYLRMAEGKIRGDLPRGFEEILERVRARHGVGMVVPRVEIDAEPLGIDRFDKLDLIGGSPRDAAVVLDDKRDAVLLRQGNERTKSRTAAAKAISAVTPLGMIAAGSVLL